MPSAHSRRSSAHDADRRIVSAKSVECEGADAFSNPDAFSAVDRHLYSLDPEPPKPKIVTTVILDTINRDGTPRLDLWHTDELSLRERLQAQVGSRFYPDEFILKRVNHEYTKAAREVAQHAGVKADIGSSSFLVRDEIEENHPKPRDKNVLTYTFFDLPPRIQWTLEDKMGSVVHSMIFAPVVRVDAHRRRYPFHVDPDAESNFILPMSHKLGPNYARIQVGMDRWFARQPSPGMSIYEVLSKPEQDLRDSVIILDGYSAEREFRLKGSGSGITDRDAMVAYPRVGNEIYRIAGQYPGEGGLAVVRPIENKAKEIFAMLEHSHR